MVSKQVPWIRSLKVGSSSGSASYWLYALRKFLHFCLLVYKMRILFSALLTSQDCSEAQMR